jgi:predicted enzyme related to lactoylglutathione lyase
MATFRLEHVGIVVNPAKREETVRFYEQVFGWHTVRELGQVALFIGDGSGGRIELLFNDAAGPMNAPNHLAFVVPFDEFDQVAERIKATGVPMDARGTNPAGRILFFSDPAGTRAQIVGRPEPMPE